MTHTTCNIAFITNPVLIAPAQPENGAGISMYTSQGGIVASGGVRAKDRMLYIYTLCIYTVQYPLVFGDQHYPELAEKPG